MTADRSLTYGDALIERLSEDLTTRFGRGFSPQNLWQMRAFHLAWPTPQILQTPSGELDKTRRELEGRRGRADGSEWHDERLHPESRERLAA